MLVTFLPPDDSGLTTEIYRSDIITKYVYVYRECVNLLVCPKSVGICTVYSM
jgi:hypothetical protein